MKEVSFSLVLLISIPNFPKLFRVLGIANKFFLKLNQLFFKALVNGDRFLLESKGLDLLLLYFPLQIPSIVFGATDAGLDIVEDILVLLHNFFEGFGHAGLTVDGVLNILHMLLYFFQLLLFVADNFLVSRYDIPQLNLLFLNLQL